MPTDKKNNQPSDKKPVDNYIRFSTMGLQMGATIFLFTYAGIKLDEWLKLSFPAFTISLALFSVIASIYVVAKQAMKG